MISIPCISPRYLFYTFYSDVYLYCMLHLVVGSTFLVSHSKLQVSKAEVQYLWRQRKKNLYLKSQSSLSAVYAIKKKSKCLLTLFIFGEGGRRKRGKKQFGFCFNALSQRVVIHSLHIIMDAHGSPGFHDGLNSR